MTIEDLAKWDSGEMEFQYRGFVVLWTGWKDKENCHDWTLPEGRVAQFCCFVQEGSIFVGIPCLTVNQVERGGKFTIKHQAVSYDSPI